MFSNTQYNYYIKVDTHLTIDLKEYFIHMYIYLIVRI